MESWCRMQQDIANNTADRLRELSKLTVQRCFYKLPCQSRPMGEGV